MARAGDRRAFLKGNFGCGGVGQRTKPHAERDYRPYRQRKRRFFHGKQQSFPRRCEYKRRNGGGLKGIRGGPRRNPENFGAHQMIERKLGSATRDAYGKALVEIGREMPEVGVMDADLSKSTKTEMFGKAYPDRFIDIGIQEANLVGIASGLASCGKIPFISSFACFLMCKGFEQLRVGVAFSELNVKVVTSHGGISVGEDGASHQSVEDFALAGTLPNFTVIVPADEFSAKSLIKQCATYKGPVYIRTGRSKAPILYNEKTTFQICKGIPIRSGKDIT